MSRVKWRHDKKDESGPVEEDASIRADVERLLPIAMQVGELMEDAELIALYADSRDESVIRAVFSVERGSSINVVDLPKDAQSVDDAPDEADHYCTGLELAQELVASSKIIEGKSEILAALASFDRTLHIALAKGWVQILSEHGPVAKPGK